MGCRSKLDSGPVRGEKIRDSHTASGTFCGESPGKSGKAVPVSGRSADFTQRRCGRRGGPAPALFDSGCAAWGAGSGDSGEWRREQSGRCHGGSCPPSPGTPGYIMAEPFQENCRNTKCRKEIRRKNTRYWKNTKGEAVFCGKQGLGKVRLFLLGRMCGWL